MNGHSLRACRRNDGSSDSDSKRAMKTTAHRLPRRFWIDQTEVTNKMYAVCGSRSMPKPWWRRLHYQLGLSHGTMLRHIVNGLADVCPRNWWEKAARVQMGVSPSNSPATCEQANIHGCGGRASRSSSDVSPAR